MGTINNPHAAAAQHVTDLVSLDDGITRPYRKRRF
jgi:hypothetical protein